MFKIGDRVLFKSVTCPDDTGTVVRKVTPVETAYESQDDMWWVLWDSDKQEKYAREVTLTKIYDRNPFDIDDLSLSVSELLKLAARKAIEKDDIHLATKILNLVAF